MKFKLLLIPVLLMLALPIAFSGTATFIDGKIANETFDNLDNWGVSPATTATGTCDTFEGNLRCTTDEDIMYVHSLPNVSINTNNYSCGFDMSLGASGDTYLGSWIWAENSTGSGGGAIIMQNVLMSGATASTRYAKDATVMPIAGITDDGTWHDWTMTVFENRSIGTYINGTEKTMLKPFDITGDQSGYPVFWYFISQTGSGNMLMDNFTCWNGTIFQYPAEAPPDTEPASMLLINLTSEAGATSIGQIIFNGSDEELGKLSCLARTNDTTPTFRLTTNETATCAGGQYGFDLNYTDWKAYDTNSEASTTGGLNHIWTLVNDNATNRTGPHYFSWGCKDSDNNENRTSTSGLVCVNITDPDAPNTTLHTPSVDAFFIRSDNDTSANFTFSSTDNYDRNFTAELLINEVVQITNSTYLNGTNVTYILDLSSFSLGYHNWSVRTTDSFNNINYSGNRSFSIQQKVTVNLFFNLVNDTKKYEYRSIANISANCTDAFGGDCTVTISLNAPNYGVDFISGTNKVHFDYNITLLRIWNFSHGPISTTGTSSLILNVTSDNNTQIVRVSVNATSSGTSSNLNITYGSRTIKFRGDLKTIYLTDDEFIHNNIYKKAVNLTYLTAGSNFIYYNFSGISNPINITFQLTGFDLDADNEFSYIEHFNGTAGVKGFNETLTYQADAPLGVFDEFVVNVTGRWSLTITTGSCAGFGLKYTDAGLFFGGSLQPGECRQYVTYTGLEADMRNTSIIEIIYRENTIWEGTGARGDANLYAFDGTNQVLLRGVLNSNLKQVLNITLIKKSEDYKTWEVIVNGSSTGIRDLSSLDFTKQIKLRWFTLIIGNGADRVGGADFELQSLKWGGAWLNYSTNNGTYKPTGNITSNVLNVTKTNISKATLTATVYEPTNTKIDFYLSNTCNATIPTFESITSGIIHTFDTKGNEICWRAVLNSSVNITSPVVRKVEIDITATSIKNVTVDLGNDGNDDFTFVGTLNSTTSPIFVNLSPTARQLNIIKISSATAGLIMVDQFEVNSSINPITLNETEFEKCDFNCSINFTFGGDDLIVNGLELDFLGSWNYTAVARFGSLVKEFVIQVYYSNFNLSLPSGYSWYDVFPSSKDSKNVTPYLQTQLTPIWNIFNLAYDELIDIYVKTNETLNSCLNITYTNNTNRIVNITNESFVWINGTAVQLANTNLVNSSGVVFNQSATGLTIGSNNYTIDYADGTITLNSSITSNTTRTNQSIIIILDSLFGSDNSTLLEFIPLQSETVRNATSPFYLLNKDIDYRMDYTLGNFTLINETFNQTILFITYNYSTSISYGDRKQFGINYSYFTYGFNYETDYTFKLNTTYQKILTNISVDLDAYPSKGIWNWWSLYNCTSRFEIPWVYFSSICTSCHFDITQLDYYNILET